MIFYPNILSVNQKEILPKLFELSQRGIYMAGGTALALYLGHRSSQDFDFYSGEKFNNLELADTIKKQVEKVELVRQAENTLELKIKDVSFSCFYYPYKLLYPAVDFEKISLASISDIIAMKAVSIAQRGKRRDFIDIFEVLKKYSLEEILSFVKNKYPTFDAVHIIKGLTYFEDAENDILSERGIEIFDKEYSWKTVKETIQKAVLAYDITT